MYAVTGASGHVGNALVRHLVELGKTTRVLLHNPEHDFPLRGLNVEKVRADILDPVSLEKAFEGCEGVFHVAGKVTIVPGMKKELRRINIQGTENVAKACLKAGVKRMIYTSSIHAFSVPAKGIPITEDSPMMPENPYGNYDWSKAQSTKTALAFNSERLEVISVHPSGVIGPWDFLGSRLGNFFRQYVEGRLPAILDGEFDFVDCRDVAMGQAAAMEKGRPGEKYLLTGRIVPITEFISLLQQVSGMRKTPPKLPLWLAFTASWGALLPWLITKKEPLFTPYSIQTLGTNCLAPHDKASRELGYAPRPTLESVRDALSFFREYGIIK